VRLVASVAFLAACLGLAGCATFGKKGSTAPASQPPAGRGPATPTAQPVNQVGTNATLNGILAGQVLDSYNRAPPSVYIQVAEARDSPAPAGAPIEVAADSQGYFTIQGLQPGKHYQLTARSRNGDQLLAGSSWATPPDPKILIRVSEDFATASTPAIPPAPGWPGNRAAAASQPAAPPSQRAGGPDRGWSPGAGNRASPARAAEILPPIGVGNASPPAGVNPSQPVVTRPENIVKESTLAAATSPTVVVPPQDGLGDPAASTGPARVPSCVLTGQTVHNFALLDVSGQPWEYRRNHRGRLVLLDFWGTWCVHCLHSVPHLNILQRTYGPAGLEVVGIAYEEGTPMEQSQKVNRVRQRLQINYRLLLGSDRAQCPVRTQFGVINWPTLVLLDESGRIVWRSEGLEAPQIKELDTIIKQRLNVR
jgi:thiol-disulfide isomerase/thioredoxin